MVVIPGIFFGVVFVITVAFLAKVTGKKFDLLLKEKNISLPTNLAFTLPDSWGRAIGYSILILFFKNKDQSSWRYRRFQKQYKDFNFYANASKIDIFLSKMTNNIVIANNCFHIVCCYIGSIKINIYLILFVVISIGVTGAI